MGMNRRATRDARPPCMYAAYTPPSWPGHEPPISRRRFRLISHYISRHIAVDDFRTNYAAVEPG